MDATRVNAMADELEALERERQRIERQLRSAASPTVEAMLREERRWVARRKRAIERVPVCSRAALHSMGATRPCEVRDVSAHGAGVDTDVQPRVGDTVCLVLTDLDGAPSMHAVVRHVTGRRVGLEFVPRSDEVRAAAAELARRYAVHEG
jgi:hypothetical protein